MTENVENQKFTKLEEKFMSNSNTALAKTFAATLFGILLCSFGPFGLFAPAAFAFSYLNGPMKKTFLIQLGLYAIALIAFGKSFFIGGSGLLAIYATLIGFGIGFSIRSKVPPMAIVLNTGSVLVGGLALMAGVLVALSDQSVYEIVLTQTKFYIDQLKNNKEFTEALNLGGEQAIMLKSLISSPDKIALELISWTPAVVISGTFLSVWVSLYYVLRNSFSWRKKVEFPYGVVHLTYFKLPFNYVYLVMLGIVIILVGDYFNPHLQTVGMNLLYSLGTLYFFQGFGVCYDFFVIKRIRGFFRSFSLMFILVFAWKAVVFLGLFDVWFNFRKYFLNKEEGDK
tara:strand:- start:6266 stop:7288 length:1023 start_codon:yes stop_codon:yes gene_type:complete